MDKVKEILSPHGRKYDEDKLYGKNGAGTETPQPATDPKIRSPLAQGHIQDEMGSSEGPTTSISAPADLTGMTGQYVTGRDASPISEQERKKHGTAMGLASATMASGAVGQQHPSTEQEPSL